MSEHAKDPSEELAEWLTDSGRRRWSAVRATEAAESQVPVESSEELMRYLEQLTARKFRTHDDIRAFLSEVSARDREDSREHGRRQVVKDTVLLLCLLTAYIQYNFLDVNLQIARLPSTVIFVPVDARSAPQRPRHHADSTNTLETGVSLRRT